MRLPVGGRVDRSAPLRFTIDGAEYAGYPGDTVASALVASGRLEVAPSIYRRRPRGIVGAGVEEPNALIQLAGSCSEPMLPATTVELYDGLSASFLSGRGRLDEAEDDAVYDKKYVHADVLVVGGGPAGLSAALAAGGSGARVVLVDDQAELGGSLLSAQAAIDGLPASHWVAAVRAELAATPDVLTLTRSTAVGHYDHNLVLVAEHRTDHLGPEAPPAVSRQRLWHVRAKQVVLATGAHERPVVFADNDRPGVMLASAVRGYLNRYAAVPGSNAVFFTTNDSGYGAALDALVAGMRVAALVDSRPRPAERLVARVRAAGVEVVSGSAVTGTDGSPRVAAVRVAALGDDGLTVGPAREIGCDLLAVSGGWDPVVSLFSQARGRLRYDEGRAAFVPDRIPPGVRVAGSVTGAYDLAGCLAQGLRAGAAAATAAGFQPVVPPAPRCDGDDPPAPPRALRLVPGPGTEPAGWDTHFVDLQRDATVADVYRATGAGMRSVEHVKRYTTIGTAHDQGRTSGVNAIAVIAQALGGGSPGAVGTTTFRPPYTPVSFALLAGRDRGRLHDPVRVTSIHQWHIAHGAKFENVGQWKRPWYYPQPGEDMEAAVLRECRAAREGVAVMDATTLGKIEIVGPDAPEFLNRIYTNAFAKLAVGSGRYGMMCKADGMLFDDGVVLRLAEDRFLATTTTGNAAAVLDWLEEWLQTEWPDLRVYCTSVTEQWATIAVVGPLSRRVVGDLAPALDVSADEFPFMTFRETTLASGIPARIARISFSGELAYEINVQSWYGLAVWEAVLDAGADLSITPYGTETMHVLRAEKGYVIVGQDTDGTVTPLDLGMDWIVSKQKFFVGKRSLRRFDTARLDRKHLVGLLPVEPDRLLPEGAQLVAEGVPLDQLPIPMLGHVTSSYRSAALGRTFALALVKNGRNRIGDTVYAPLGDGTVAATVTEPVFYDPEGDRRDG